MREKEGGAREGGLEGGGEKQRGREGQISGRRKDKTSERWRDPDGELKNKPFTEITDVGERGRARIIMCKSVENKQPQTNTDTQKPTRAL